MYEAAKVNPTKVSLKSLGLGICIAVATSKVLVYPYPSIYVLSIAIFHLLEFLSTSLWNQDEIDDDSFILTDWDLHLVNSASLVEYLVASYFHIPQFQPLKLVGAGLIICGQLFRTLSMYTAKQSFNHYIQRTKSDKHVLVTNGVYSISRHPSYFGFFWWFVGLRLLLGNWVILSIGAYKIWQFFNTRIQFEELFLTKFFKDYNVYREKTPVLIPFIN